jgi:low affinity Fe/Cu permease
MKSDEKEFSKQGFQEVFHAFANLISRWSGSPWAFILALSTIVVWLITGPIFDFSDTWQLVINTGTTIVTFLMVFLIQHTQNRESRAINLKLDELIRVIQDARNDLVDIENGRDEEVEELESQYRRLGEHQRNTANVHQQKID